MGSYTKEAMKLFGQIAESTAPYFLDLKGNLKRARIKMSVQEYIGVAILTSFLVFLIELPLLSFIIAIVIQSWMLAFTSSFILSAFLTIIFFMMFINYPKVIIKERGKRLENTLPFASLYLSTLFGSRLPLHKVFSLFFQIQQIRRDNRGDNCHNE